MNLARTLTKWLAPAAALFALACALLAPAEAGVTGRPRPHARAQNTNTSVGEMKQPVPADSILRGRVVYDDTSRPVRRARVMLITDDGGRGEFAALTDARGNFLIKGVRAGTYYAFVDMPGVLSPLGFVSIDELRTAPGMPSLGEGRKFFDLIEVDGKQDVTVTVHARRGAAIAGRVSHADGDPAVNVSITLMRRSPDGRVQKYLTGASISSLSGLRTDDRGMFRLMGLPPGEYLVGVNETMSHGAEEISGSSAGEDISGVFRGMFTPQLVMTFYPSVTSLKEAGVVKVGAGDERTDIDITIPERDLRTVAGVVRARRGGRLVGNARVNIVRRDDPLAPGGQLVGFSDSAGQNGTTTDEQGRWQLNEIPDGPYVVHVKPPEEFEAVTTALSNANTLPPSSSGDGTVVTSESEYRPPRRKRSYAPIRVNLDVSGGDVSEFVVEVAEGARVTGTISVEGGPTPRYGHVSMMRLGEGGAAPDYAGVQSGGLDDGRFAIEGLPAGRFLLQPGVSGADSGIYLKSISWNGKDLQREPLEVAEGASVEGVRIVYARNPATLNVTVRAAAGKRTTGQYFVALVPADLSTWLPQTNSDFCMTSESGTCPIVAPPGEYRVVAMRRQTQPSAYEQEVRRLAPTAPRVTLREGETKRVEVDAPDN